MNAQWSEKLESDQVACFCQEMRAQFDGTLPEISIYFEDAQRLQSAIEIFLKNANIPLSTMCREGSRRREQLSGKYTTPELLRLVQNGQHLLLKKSFGLPDLGIGVLEDSLRIDFRPGPEWNDEHIVRLCETLRVVREKVSVTDIYLDEMEEHFSRVGASGFQELLED
jgi:hypothetical protein